MLANKSDNGGHAQRSENPNSPKNNALGNLNLIVKPSAVSKKLPVSSDDNCCNSGITGGQISRSDQALTDVATLGEMFGLSSVGHEGCVSGGCGCSPSPDDSFGGFQSERVLGVDSRNRTPVQFGLPKNVVDGDSTLGHSNAGIPKQQPGNVSEPNVDPRLQENDVKGLCCQSNNSEKREQHSSDGHDSARARVQGSGFHAISLAQKTKPEGSCC